MFAGTLTRNVETATAQYSGMIHGARFDIAIQLETRPKMSARSPDFDVTAVNKSGRKVRIGTAWNETGNTSGNPYISMQIDVGLGPFRVNAVQTKEACAAQSGEFEIIPLVSNGLMKSGSISGELTAMDADNAFTGYIANMMFDLEFMLIENSYKSEETHPDYRIEVSSPRGTPIRVGSAWMAKSSRTGNDYLSLLINTPDGDLRVNAVPNSRRQISEDLRSSHKIETVRQTNPLGKRKSSQAPRVWSMSNAKQILAMLQSKADGDDEHFYSIALQVAAAEARQGRRTLAEDLRAAVDKAREKAASGQTVAVPFASPRGDLADLIEMRPPRFDLESVVMNASLRARLDDVVLQQHKRDWLREHGKTPNRRVLFVGPPGSGKTMSAEALAGELRLPLFVIRLESLITRFMGETAAKLRLVFDETARHRGVYLFDEFDAVGGNRGATNDVAEMRRVLNSFLQFMEEPNSTDSVIIGATNYPDLLDPALLRRFDLVMEFCPPTDEEIRTIIKFNLRPMKFPNLKWKSILASAQGLSQSEIARATEDAVKSAILAERKNVTSDDLLRRLNDRREMREAFRPSAVNK